MGLTSAIAAFRRSSPTKEGAAAAATLSTTTTSAATNGVHDSPPVNDIGGKVRFVFFFAICVALDDATAEQEWGREECPEKEGTRRVCSSSLFQFRKGINFSVCVFAEKKTSVEFANALSAATPLFFAPAARALMSARTCSVLGVGSREKLRENERECGGRKKNTSKKT